MNQYTLRTLKSSAKKISQEHEIPYSKALDIIAEREGCTTWSLLMSQYENNSIVDMEMAWNTLFPSSLGMIAASKNVGKMSFAINLCLRAARDQQNVAYISVGSPAVQVEHKFSAVNSAVEQVLFSRKPDDISADELTKVENSLNAFSKLPITIEDDVFSDEDVIKICNKSYSFICIDHLQALRIEDIERFTFELKNICHSKAISIIVINQVSDDFNNNFVIENIVGGKNITRHFDSVLGLERDTGSEVNIAKMQILKSKFKSGEPVKVDFNRHTGIFSW